MGIVIICLFLCYIIHQLEVIASNQLKLAAQPRYGQTTKGATDEQD